MPASTPFSAQPVHRIDITKVPLRHNAENTRKVVQIT